MHLIKIFSILLKTIALQNNNHQKNLDEFGKEGTHIANLELIIEKSETTEEHNNASQSKYDYLNESLIKSLAKFNNSYDSKDTVSLGDIDIDDNMVDTENIFGADLDIDKIIRSQL